MLVNGMTNAILEPSFVSKGIEMYQEAGTLKAPSMFVFAIPKNCFYSISLYRFPNKASQMEQSMLSMLGQ
jgi:hypothetical protein